MSEQVPSKTLADIVERIAEHTSYGLLSEQERGHLMDAAHALRAAPEQPPGLALEQLRADIEAPLRREIDAAFQMLDVCGVSKERARTLANGISVLDSRYQKAMTAREPPVTSLCSREALDAVLSKYWPDLELRERSTSPPRVLPPNCLATHARWLKEAAKQIADGGHYGWGNTCTQAAEEIERVLGLTKGAV